MSLVKEITFLFSTFGLHLFVLVVSAMGLQHDQTMAMRLLARFNSWNSV